MWFETNVIDQILMKLEEFQESASRWALKSIEHLIFNVMKYHGFHGGCDIDFPLEIKNKEACINIKFNEYE